MGDANNFHYLQGSKLPEIFMYLITSGADGRLCVFVWFRLQLRQHSFMKHRDKSPRWLDTTTGRVHGDDNSASSSSSASTTATAQTSTAKSSELSLIHI